MKHLITILLVICLQAAYCQQPDIILIYVDDSPHGMTLTDGGPPFLITPNIDWIKKNGMDFTNNYCVISLCAPSRSVLMTGRYPNETGVTDNVSQPNFNMALPSLGAKMKAAGYYTAAIGKFHDVIGAHGSDDWNYRLESVSQQDDKNIKWSRNGANPKKAGTDTMITKVIIDSATAVLNRINQPVFVVLLLRVPHTPFKAPAPYNTMFANDVLPWGSDTVYYSNLYPSFLYSQAPGNYKTTAKLIPIVKDQLRSIAYLDSRLPQLFAATDSNDMIIYTSDNGWMNDQHGLYKKRYPYGPSVNVPLYIKFNQWFPDAGSSSILTSNVDLYATILHAAGADYSGSKGYSIKDLYDRAASRQTAYYQMYYTAEDNGGDVAYSIAIWDSTYKLIHWGCTERTEQFFDLVNDRQEMNNLIYSVALQDTIAAYRIKLDALAALYGDADDTVIDCELVEH